MQLVAGLAVGLNTYAYVGGNPLGATDPSGEIAFLIPVVWAAVEFGLALYDLYDTGSTLLDPCATGGQKLMSAGLLLLGIVLPGGGYTKADDLARQAPDFIASPGGTVFPVPKGSVGPSPVRTGKGMEFTGGAGGNGLSPSTTNFRSMDPVTSGKYQYPDGYGSYSNASGQTINPLTGQTVSKSDPWWHIPN